MAYCKLHGCPPGSDWHDELYEYHAQVCEDERFGRGGRVMVLRYHPQVSSSNPVGQCLLRCNWDVQCMDRVIRFPAAWLAGTPRAQRECCDEVVCVEAGGQQHALDAPMDATPGPSPEERVGAQLTSLPGGARLQSFDDSEASAGFDEGDEPSDGEGFDCPPDDVHASATAAPAHPHSDQPVPDAVQSEGELVRLLFLDAAERMFRDAEDSSHYTGDYMTKWSERVGAVMPEISRGVESLRSVQSFEQRDVAAEGGMVDSYIFKRVQGKTAPRRGASWWRQADRR